MNKRLSRLIVITIVIWGMEKFGFTIWLGAHPSWSAQVTYIGIAIGIVASLYTEYAAKRYDISPTKLMIGYIAATLITAAITLLYGKAAFVASYAANGFAGKVWYFGFMLLIGAIFTTLIQQSQLQSRVRMRDKKIDEKS